MRLVVVIAALGAACSDMTGGAVDAPDAKVGGGIDASVFTPLHDAATTTAAPDAALVEDLDMTLADFAGIAGFMTPAGRGYHVANPLGHEAEALAAASSATGGTFPVGSIVEVNPGEVMVKRRRGFDATTNDWEFFRVIYGSDGVTPERIDLRGTEATDCFMCHSTVSSSMWDFMCDHPGS
jgi:hypothetical protein